MSDDTTTQSPSTKSTSQPRSWRESGPLYVNLHLVFWLILMTPSIVSLAVIWLLAITSHNVLVSVLTQGESEGSTAKSEEVKSSTQVLSHFSKSLSQLSDVALKTASEGVQQLSTSLFDIKKSETSSSSKTTKEQKTTESENSTTASS